MIADAYYCDFKNHLVESSSIVGIRIIEDIFDKQLSYPSVFKFKKNDNSVLCHYCTECYNAQVLRPAAIAVNRKVEGDRAYELKIKELAYAFRLSVVRNYWHKTRKFTDTDSKSTKRKKT